MENFAMNTASLSAWVQGLALSSQAREMAGFALRTWLASMLALYLAYSFQLDDPYWACLTVWTVAHPIPGMVLSKSLYRVIGTLIGAIFGVMLIALFAQAPELFVLGLALLVGGCTVAASLLTNFRVYGAALTAYTAGIIAAGAIAAPDQIFFIAMARASAILIGIACAVLVTAIFSPHRAEGEARQKLLAVLKDAARRAAYSWQGLPEVRRQIGKKLIDDIVALNTLIEFATAESGEFRVQANNARSLLAHIFGMISARRSLDAHLNRCGWPRHSGLEVFHEVIIDFFNEMPEKLDHGQIDELIGDIHDARRQLELLQPEQDTASSGDLVSERLIIDRLEDLLSHFGGALEDWRDILEGRWDDKPRLFLNFHRDLRAAWINGLRSFLAVGATGAFWIASAWPDGPNALVFVCVIMSLISSRPNPDRIGWTLFYAYGVAAFVAVFCKYLILPMGSGFEFLTLALGLFLFPLGLLMARPSTATAALALAVTFIRLVQPSNPMTYDLAGTVNFALGIQVGVLFGTLAFALVFPADPLAARRYVTYRIRLGLELLARLHPIPSFSRWETRMYDRVNRLHDSQNPSGTPTDEWLEAGLGALTLGNEILRLRHWLTTERLSSELRGATQKVIHAFGRFSPEPQRAAAEVKDKMEQVAHFDPGPGREERRAWARILGALAEIDVYLAHHPRLLKLVKTT
jgi:uncharacterized membrane protein YccC